MRLCMDIAVPLLAMVHMTYICEAALLRKSTAADFLRPVREKRAAECFPAGCSMEDSEAEELLEANSHYVSSGWQTHWRIDKGQFEDAVEWRHWGRGELESW
ncbi:uncharacterized protein isoform X1 [Salmo salar]|uniref:Uncharacterized protein isoform X1 n=1 Tax=Salmo salar TaxID=8030 RepID=A0A1S3P364_SALSA|nr:uncharacterized protein LOC106582949 isoform X1 [Salmo salar]|eukprot:XP_014022067.1 PREDICTED: uncharacterized protein LOC106582949 isoform X1 [Salmo salar]